MAIRMPVSTDPTASGTIAYQPVRSMAIQAARTVSAFAVVTAETPRTRYATTAPIHPIENARWTVSTNLRTPGVMALSGRCDPCVRERRASIGWIGEIGRAHV